jgi:Xaa-Pro aminopeptidase
MEYYQVQNIAIKTMEYIKTVLRPGMTLCEVRSLCEKKMIEMGADSFWYWNVGAFIFSGDETIISISGSEYATSDRTIAENDIITIDLSPQRANIWGDYARTIIIEDGQVVSDISSIKNAQWRNGLQMEEALHSEMKKFVTADTTFEELYYYMNRYIIDHGYVNLDFISNLGHSIVKRKEDRVYIEKGNTKKLSQVNFFTFEPHISLPGSKYGYKKEDIYFFKNGKLMEL